MGGNVSNLDAIRSRLEALMRHAGGTDYAGQVIADNIALVAEVEQLRGERASVTAYLRAVATSPQWTGEGKPLLSTEARLVLILQAANIERGDHRREKDE